MDLIGAVEIASCKAWPALSVENYGGWQFRSANGYTKRANSAYAVAPIRPFQQVLAAAERYYGQIGQEVLFRLSPLAGYESRRILMANGYSSVDPCNVMTTVPTQGDNVSSIVISEGLDDGWLVGFAAASQMSLKRSEAHKKIVSNIRGRIASATIYDEEAAVGFGMAVLDGELTGIFDVVVSSAHRCRGHGRAVTKALCSWASQARSKVVYLQVQAENAPARALYKSLRFSDAYSYEYFSRPEQPA